MPFREGKMSKTHKILRLNDKQLGGCEWTMRSSSQTATLLTKNISDMLKILVDDVEIKSMHWFNTYQLSINKENNQLVTLPTLTKI